MEKKNSPEDYVVEKDGFAEVTLSRPRTIEGAKVETLRVREPTVEDMERHQDGKGTDAQREVQMLANLCELPPEEIRKFPLRDYARLQAAFGLFTS